ncbi:MAG: hypothetical protein FH756_02390 [Firmicutes bacterium]|nr:hypothetical protein [Bacillota bacterium]
MNARVDKLMEVIRKTVLRLFPELAGSYHLTSNAKVVKVTQEALHVQPLLKDGAVNEESPVITAPPLPYKLKPGDLVRLKFLYGDPSEPYAETVTTAALGQITGGGLIIEGYGEVADYLVAEHLAAHSRMGTTTSPVDDKGDSLPGATTSSLTRFDINAHLKAGDKVAALPIEEGARFVVVAKL